MVALLARAAVRRDAREGRGTEPGQGDRLIDMGYYSGGPGGGHGTAIRVTRDPQAFARAMMPRR